MYNDASSFRENTTMDHYAKDGDQGWSVLRAVFTIMFCDTNILFGKILESYSKIV